MFPSKELFLKKEIEYEVCFWFVCGVVLCGFFWAGYATHSGVCSWWECCGDSATARACESWWFFAVQYLDGGNDGIMDPISHDIS